jgi:ribosomal protein S18 acetylase RimI-like enzyme
VRFREATPEDAASIAALHAESWRAHYRGAYRDEYLDGDVAVDRLRVWEARLAAPPPNQLVVLAEEDGDLIGFACAYGGHDATWGSLLDNIHVRREHQRRGVGAGLLAEVAAWCRAGYGGSGLYLWVLEQNDRAQRFYRSLGASDQGGEISEPPGGGKIHGRRYAWRTVPDLPRPHAPRP